jgi:putative acetyltransferase
VNVQIRPYHSPEAAALYAVFVEAVQIGAADHYTLAQRLAWAPDQPMPDGWPDRLATPETWVADVDGAIAGFMAVSTAGYIDLAFVRPRWMGRAVAQAVYERIVERAQRADLPCLTTHASHPARHFFARNGWQVDAAEIVDRNGESLTRFAMSLILEDPK